MSEKLLKVSDAAKYIGVSQQTLRNYGRKGILPPDEIYPSGHRFYRKESLDAFIQSYMDLKRE